MNVIRTALFPFVPAGFVLLNKCIPKPNLSNVLFSKLSVLELKDDSFDFSLDFNLVSMNDSNINDYT